MSKILIGKNLGLTVYIVNDIICNINDYSTTDDYKICNIKDVDNWLASKSNLYKYFITYPIVKDYVDKMKRELNEIDSLIPNLLN